MNLGLLQVRCNFLDSDNIGEDIHLQNQPQDSAELLIVNTL